MGTTKIILSMGDSRINIFYKQGNKYYVNLSQMCDVSELHTTRLSCYGSRESEKHRAETEDYFTLEFEELFMLSRLKKFHESRNHGIKKHQIVQEFISFLLQLLHPESHEVARAKYGIFMVLIENLEKELRILLTILGDSSLMLSDDIGNKEIQKLLVEFEAVANEAGSLVYSLVIPTDSGLDYALAILPDLAYLRLVEKFGVVLNQIDLLKASTMKFLNIQPSTSRSACITPKSASAMDSLLTVGSLISDLEDLMNREDDSNIADVKDQIKTLHQGLTCLQSSIMEIGSPQPSEIGELKEPLIRIGDMAHKAEYVIISFLVGDAPLWYLINRLTDFNAKIELIGTELVEITNKYKSQSLKVAENFSARLSLQAKENAEIDGVTVGLEDNSINILDQLVGGGTESLQVISIFGMPGIGKTTLAKNLYNHLSVIYRFDRLSWCFISQTYQRHSVLANILIQIASELEKDRILKMEEESLVEHIYKTFKRRRYLIVMDDIWDPNVWDDLQRCFPDDRNGSRILLTTRNKDVAPPNSIIYAMPSLSNDQCWELLKKKVFNDEPCPPELLGIGKKIAEKCQGLPLAVVVIAGVLSTMDRERGTWEEVLQENIASHTFDGEDNSLVMQILELSYKHLPDRLKPCFLYFGSFPEDEEIPARQLMRLWIAEGFVHKEERKSAENVAEECLVELIDKSLVMVAKRRSDGAVKACVIHDLLRDLCLKICEDEKFLKLEKCNIDSMLQEHAISRKAIRSYSTIWSNCQHIRSFRSTYMTSRFYVRDLRLLRILDSYYGLKQLIGIEHLVNLRYLVIFGDLVASIGKLVNLEYLRVESDNPIILSPTIMKMRKLRHVHVQPDTARYHEDCSVAQHNNLECLSVINIYSRKDEEMLKCSPHLRKLKLSTTRHVDLSFFTQLESLNLYFSFDIGIREISLPSEVKKLTLTCGVPKLPWDIMSIIGGLKKLEILKLKGLGLSDAPSGEKWDTREGEFQELRFLELNFVDITQWSVDSSEHFPQLQRLVLHNCGYLEEIPSEIGEIATLEMIEVKGYCRESLVESAKRIQQEQLDMGNEELKVVITGIPYPNTARGQSS